MSCKAGRGEAMLKTPQFFTSCCFSTLDGIAAGRRGGQALKGPQVAGSEYGESAALDSPKRRAENLEAVPGFEPARESFSLQ